MKSRTAQLSLTVICVLLGALLMMQFRTLGTIAKTSLTESSADQAQIVANLYESNSTLRKEVQKLQVQHQEYELALSAGGLGSLVADLNKYRVINGLSEARGPGVELVIVADVRAEDVQDLINEFRNAGAEALALNDQRVTLRSSVRPYMGGIALGNIHLDAPYVFQAIGSPDILERALTRKGGLVSYLSNTYPDANISVQKKSQLILSVYSDGYQWQFAQPVD
jgi:uncharacterized protein YlxW (UPF0749 family)